MNIETKTIKHRTTYDPAQREKALADPSLVVFSAKCLSENCGEYRRDIYLLFVKEGFYREILENRGRIPAPCPTCHNLLKIGENLSTATPEAAKAPEGTTAPRERKPRPEVVKSIKKALETPEATIDPLEKMIPYGPTPLQIIRGEVEAPVDPMAEALIGLINAKVEQSYRDEVLSLCGVYTQKGRLNVARTVVRIHKETGASAVEINRLLGLKRDTADSHLYQARKRGELPPLPAKKKRRVKK